MRGYSMFTQSKTVRTGFAAGMFVAGVLALLAPARAEAQLTFAVEGRAAVTAPFGDISDAGAETGIGLGAEVFVNFHPKMSVYAGLGRYSFGCDDNCDLGSNPRSTGISAGIKYFVHNPGDVLVWGRGGVVASTFGNDQSSSDRELGFELGAGADLPIATQLFVVPNVGFISHGAGNNFNANFLTLGLGLHYHLR